MKIQLYKLILRGSDSGVSRKQSVDGTAPLFLRPFFWGKFVLTTEGHGLAVTLNGV